MKTIVNYHDRDTYHHLPYGAARPSIGGLTLRQALRVLRGVEWGSIGGMAETDLSDGSILSVENVPSQGGGLLMGVHEVRRLGRDGKCLAKYKL